MQTVTFDQALDIIEALPEQQQDSLLEILHKRRLEKRREAFIREVKESEHQYATGQVVRGNSAAIMEALLK